MSAEAVGPADDRHGIERLGAPIGTPMNATQTSLIRVQV
jgi:hypothetical protein